jgi:hypothetical protein
LCNLVAQSPGTAKEQFRREVQKELTPRETEASELVYFQVVQERDSVIEQAIEDCVDKPNVLTSLNGYLLFLGRMPAC